ncbi:ABC transporter ATP-binding protein [Flavobacteriaceae bacterium]|nr:ABC transporter ATP-binding protein [Flavobacteriaceae bacterium]MDA9852097.1 ABC transporter ATP-binding protein [Flavobacteriaceae bacterium]MDC0386008.1 ABC transporter ATP-binding protein [Flavobacteriaceae bacterium]
MQSEKKPLVSVQNASLSIGGHPILKALSFTIEQQEIVAIVGESGSGKSMTALTLMGLQPKKATLNAEQLTFESQDLRTLTPQEWQKRRGNTLGMVFQEPQSSLNPTQKCGNQLLEVLQIHRKMNFREGEKLVKKVLDEVQLYETKRVFKSYPHELSGGQKQRIMIAMALLCKPKLLIADEPTTALDVTVQKEIIELLKSLQKKYKMSVLFISHDLALVKQLADRVLVMYQGSIVESGTSKFLFKNPKHPYTKGLLFARPEVGVRLERLPTLKDYYDGDFVPKKISSIKRQNRLKKIYSETPLIEVRELEKSYVKKNGLGSTSRFQAVKPISFSLYPQETLGLVGESGCGKSTLAKTLVCLDPATSGALYWQGVKIDPKNKSQVGQLRKDIQFIFQDPYAALHPYKTIRSTLEEVLLVHYSKNKVAVCKRALELLDQVGLTSEFAHRYPHELSGGQRQRVVIARALAVGPKVLLCDESVAALDISVQAQVLNLLNDLKKALGLSYLFISHDLAVVKYMSDRIMVMQEGSMVELQEADALYENPKKTYTQKLIEAIP